MSVGGIVSVAISLAGVVILALLVWWLWPRQLS
jgi:hypothetical protein